MHIVQKCCLVGRGQTIEGRQSVGLKLVLFRYVSPECCFVHVVKPEEGRACRACHEDHGTKHNYLVRASVPYGPAGWMLDLNYKETKTGGRCSETCHDKQTYNNKGSRPKDVAAEYTRKQENQQKSKKNKNKKRKKR